MSEDKYVQWAWMVRDMRDMAKTSWRNEHAPAVSVDDLFARHLRKVRIIIDELPEGNWQIAIRVTARRAAQNEWYFFKVRRLMGYYYIV